MRWRSLGTRTLAAALAVVVPSEAARAENLAQAWGIALSVNQGLQAQQQTSVSAGFDVKAAESARYVAVRTYNLNNFLTPSPTVRANVADKSSSSTGTGTGRPDPRRSAGRPYPGSSPWARVRRSCRSP